MEGIYWITRLDGINVLLIVLLVICIVASILGGCGYIVTKGDSFIDDCWKELWAKLFKYCFPSSIIVSLLITFTPTTKEALMIWGVGGTIEYIKTNDTAKQLPDKCIDALDKWVDSLNEDNKDKH